MKRKRRMIATVVAVLISIAAALPAAAQETDSAPATGMEADVGSDTNGFSDDSVYPFVVEKLSQEDFERAAAEAKPAAEEKESGAQDALKGASDGADGSEQASEEYIYENDVLEIGGGFWRISTPEMTSSRIVISGSTGLIFSGVDVLAQDGAAMTVAPGADVRIILEQGSISCLMGAMGYPAISLGDTDTEQDNEESGEQKAALTVYGCGYLTVEGGIGCAAIEGSLTDRTTPDPLEEDAELADAERISFIDNIEEPAAPAEDDGRVEETASEEGASDSGQEETGQAQVQQTADVSAEEVTADAAAQGQPADAAAQEETADAAAQEEAADAAAQGQPADTAAQGQAADASSEEKAADPAAGQLTAEIPGKNQETAAEVTVPAAKADAAAASDEKDRPADEEEEKSAKEAEEISFSVEAQWDDEQDHDGLRPSLLTVSLYANGEESGRTVVLHDDNDWTAEFSSLPAEVKGEPVAYSIVGEPVSGYVASIRGDSSDGYTITNVHVINPTGRSSKEEVDRIRKKADENRAEAGVTTVTTTKVARTTANYTAAIPRTSTAMVKRRSPKTADAAEPALWAVPLLIGIAGIYVWMRREQE